MSQNRAQNSGATLRSRGAVRALGLAAAVVGALVVVALVTSGWLLLFRAETSFPPGKHIRIAIASGTSTARIASQLAEAGVVKNAMMFRLRSRLSGSDAAYHAGSYDMTTGMSYTAAMASLKKGPSAQFIEVTIPEGFVIPQIAARMEEKAGIPADEFKKLAQSGAASFAEKHPYLNDAYKGSLEGYLFPKTYRIRKGSSASDVIGMMLDQFDAEIATVDMNAAQGRGMSLAQVVTIASMIERESRLDAERPLVSSVIYNRLRTDSFLKIDATIEYVLGGNRFRLTNQDLKLKTPYNTYLHKGLPPGPISNPGLKSLQAAAAPAETQLLYYVLTGKDGSHTFTTNLADFLVAKKKSKEVFGR
jgi:UPF0755 protein